MTHFPANMQSDKWLSVPDYFTGVLPYYSCNRYTKKVTLLVRQSPFIPHWAIFKILTCMVLNADHVSYFY